jgi:hypothetical protein
MKKKKNEELYIDDEDYDEDEEKYNPLIEA